MKVSTTDLEGVLLIEPDVFGDDRGFFMETWNERRYAEHKIPSKFVQDNVSKSNKGILRGLHFQNPNSQGKLVTVVDGEVFDVVVDLRRSSKTFAKSWGTNLSGKNKRQVYVPPGFAHGFCVVSEECLFSYKCTDFYNPRTEMTLSWNDPEIGIKWPIENPVLSEKDAKGLRLAEIPKERLF